MATAAVSSPPRERKPSIGAPISTLQGPVGPGFSRPKHRRTATGFGAGDIKAVESSIPENMREAYVNSSPLPSPMAPWANNTSQLAKIRMTAERVFVSLFNSPDSSFLVSPRFRHERRVRGGCLL